MATDVRVEVDDSALVAGLRQLGNGLPRASRRVGYANATSTATRIRERTPRRTGALASTVRAIPTDVGGDATYGGTLRYAGYIERRSHAVRDALDDAPARYFRDMTRAAETEVARL